MSAPKEQVLKGAEHSPFVSVVAWKHLALQELDFGDYSNCMDLQNEAGNTPLCELLEIFFIHHF